MPVGVPRSSGFQICDILDLNEQAKTAQPDSETAHSKFGSDSGNCLLISKTFILLFTNFLFQVLFKQCYQGAVTNPNLT